MELWSLRTHQWGLADLLGAGLCCGAAPAGSLAGPVLSVALTQWLQGPGKRWEHYELTKNNKPVRIPMHVKSGDTVQVQQQQAAAAAWGGGEAALVVFGTSYSRAAFLDGQPSRNLQQSLQSEAAWSAAAARLAGQRHSCAPCLRPVGALTE